MNAHAQKTPTRFAHTETTTAEASRIWEIWTKVDQWYTWDTGLKSAQLNGPFVLGAKGKLKPDKGPSARFKIVALDPGKSYTFKTKLPFGGLFVKRTLETTDKGTLFTHEVWFEGLTKNVFARKFGPRYQEMLPLVMRTIKTIAEQ